jgi:hypothetical protein
MSDQIEAELGVPAASDGDDMHIHKPKAAHSVREFLGEISVIVVGILIALGLEEAIRLVHDHATEREAREAVYAEVKQNLSYMKGRMATQACVERRLDEVGALLAKAGDGPVSPQPRWIGQPSIWFTAAQRWQAATGSGRASLFRPDEQGDLAGVYAATTAFDDAEGREQAAWAQLRGLESWSGPLGPVARVHFVSALQTARYELWETRIEAEVAFRRAKAMGVKEDIQPRTMAEGYAIPHAVCLPIDTPREKALQILSANSPPWGQPK